MQLRWYQDEACCAVWKHFKQGQTAGNPVIVAPTGAGKSLMIAEIARAAVCDYQGRVIVLAHRKELLQQNAEKIKALLPFGVTCGTYSAGLKRYATDDQIVLAGIQSVYSKAAAFGSRQLVIVDEAHLIPTTDDGMYRTFLEDLREINPKLRIVGLTATPYRTGEGEICSTENIFNSVCYNVPIKRLITEGYLCSLVSQPAKSELDTSKLKIRAGEFVQNDMQKLFDENSHVEHAAREIAEKTTGRKSVLVFCAGVIHAQHMAEKLAFITGQECGIVTGETQPLERAVLLERFKRQELRYLANVDVLSVGFDAPCIDAIAVVRATASAGLFAQICGRGFRIHEKKTDCMILDFGQNVARHGALDDPNYGKKKQRATTQDWSDEERNSPDGKRCPGCKNMMGASTKVCECGFVFPPNHEATSSGEAILSKPEKWIVNSMSVARHVKKTSDANAPNTMRVDYACTPFNEEDQGTLAGKRISEWVCLEHPHGYAKNKAYQWWKAHSNADCPDDIDEAISLFYRGAVAMPATITTLKEGGFYRITHAEIEAKPELWQEEKTEEIKYDDNGEVILDWLPF